MTDAETGTTLRDYGIARSVAAAEAHVEEWKTLAFKALVAFLKEHGKTPFLCEDVRQWSGDHGLTPPPNTRAWGAVIRAAVKNELIQQVGYRAVKNPKAHRTPAAFWKAV